jgi:hypothetical protein
VARVERIDLRGVHGATMKTERETSCEVKPQGVMMEVEAAQATLHCDFVAVNI